jgi:peroxiredoxin
MKYSTKDIFPALQLQTVRGKTLALPDSKSPYTHIQFRRWSGCPICNVHIAELRRNAGRIKQAGIHEVLFFHSQPRDIADFQKDVPFDMVGDPEKRYYKQFGVDTSLGVLLNREALWAALRGLFSGHFNLKMGGGPFELPADFLVTPNGRIVAIKYGAHAYDQWSVEELLEIVQTASLRCLPTVQGVSDDGQDAF